jgi:hypothetical protein
VDLSSSSEGFDFLDFLPGREPRFFQIGGEDAVFGTQLSRKLQSACFMDVHDPQTAIVAGNRDGTGYYMYSLYCYQSICDLER